MNEPWAISTTSGEARLRSTAARGTRPATCQITSRLMTICATSGNWPGLRGCGRRCCGAGAFAFRSPAVAGDWVSSAAAGDGGFERHRPIGSLRIQGRRMARPESATGVDRLLRPTPFAEPQGVPPELYPANASENLRCRPRAKWTRRKTKNPRTGRGRCEGSCYQTARADSRTLPAC